MHQIYRDIFGHPRRLALVAVLVVCGLCAGCGMPHGEEALSAGAEKLEKGSVDSAARLLERAAVDLRGVKPLEGKALNYLGMAYTRQGRLADAEKTFLECIRLDADFDSPHYNLGIVYFQQGEYAKAAGELQTFTQKYRDHYMAFCYLAASYSRLGDRENALLVYQGLERAIPSKNESEQNYRQVRALVANGLGVLSAQRGQSAEAAKHFEESLQRDPTLAEAHLNLAVLKETSGKGSEALPHYQQYLKLRPASAQAPQVKKLADEIRRQAAQQASASTSPPKPPPVTGTQTAVVAPPPATTSAPAAPVDKAAELMAQIRAHADARRGSEAAQASIKLGELHRDRNETAPAIGAFQNALAYDPKNTIALLRLAEVYESLNDARALGYYKQVVEKDPSQSRASRSLLELARRAGEFDTAVFACTNLVSLDKNDADSLYTLAQLFDQNLKQASDAVNIYSEFAKRFPRDRRASLAQDRIAALTAPPPSPSVPAVKRWAGSAPVLKPGDRSKAITLFNEGVMQHQQQRLDDAIALYEKAAAADPTFARAHFNLGTIYQSQGALEKATKAYETAVHAQPDYLSAHLNFALALKGGGYLQDAMEQFKKVLELNPDEAGAHLELGNLYARSPSTLRQAREHYQRFVDLSPNSPAAREVRRWLASNPVQ